MADEENPEKAEVKLQLWIGKERFLVRDCRGLKSAIGLMFDCSSEGALVEGNSIWMPFICSPLHLFFLSEDMKILKYEYAVPLTFHPSTWKVYSCRKARYCLELRRLPKNWRKGMKIKIN